MSHLKHFFSGAKDTIDNLEPLSRKRNPLVAAIIGFLFGPIGIGLYFGSFKDFAICLVFLIVLTILIPAIGLIPGWLFSAAYGLYRAIVSNEKQG